MREPQFQQRLERLGFDARERAELADHVECRAQQLERAGLSRAEAVERACAGLGDLRQIARELHAPRVRRMQLQRVLGAALVLAALGVIPLSAGVLGGLLAAAPLGLVLALVASGLWASFGPRRAAAAWRVAWEGGVVEFERARAAVRVFERGERLAWVAGPIAFLVLAAVEASRLADPPQFYSGLARAALALPCGAILGAFVFGTLATWARETCGDRGDGDRLALEGGPTGPQP
ncbi:MAG: hypothetical protein FJ299_01755 [Planctomycetes bacterium]|nr:hypothetical protein [Planctomycetota bacterium]